MSYIKARSLNFRLDHMRGTFLYLLQPKKSTNNDGSIKLSYGASFLWPKGNDLKGSLDSGVVLDVKEEAAKVAVEGFGDKAIEMIKNGVIKTPFLDGDGPQGVHKKTGERHKGFAGHNFIRTSATADHQPKFYDNKRGADGKPVQIVEQSRVKWGAYYNPVVQILAWEHPQSGKGLSFGLTMVFFDKDGEALGSGGGPNADSFFQGAPQAATTAAATTGEGAGGLFA